MREIKFRLWDKKDNKMRYQIDSIRFDIDDYLPFSVAIPSGARKSRLVNDRWIEEDGTYSPNEQKEAELMQYTGLKDKNGKEIYEGDVVRIVGEQELDYGFSLDWDDKAIVKWSDTECGYYLDLINKHERHFGDDFVATKDTFPLRKWDEGEWWIEYEVVGNVYEKAETS